MSNVTGEIKAAILASAAYERGEEISATTVRTMMRQRHSLKDCGNALAKLAQTPELERVRLGFYKRPTNARWLRMPWRRRSNQQLGIESLQFGVSV